MDPKPKPQKQEESCNGTVKMSMPCDGLETCQGGRPAHPKPKTLKFCRYFLEVAVQRTGLLPALTSEKEILVFLMGNEGVGGGVTAGDQNKELILEVGIQVC